MSLSTFRRATWNFTRIVLAPLPLLTHGERTCRLEDSTMQLKTLRLVGMLALVLLTVPLTATAQPSTHVPRIGILSDGSPLGPTPSREAFHQGLRDLGYVEGQNL